MIRVLFVCMGNICRSPLAQGVLESRLRDEQLLERVEVDSAGTHAYHTGEAPDRRGIAAARQRGIDISGQAARPVRDRDFQEFDLIIAMDEDNKRRLESVCPEGHLDKLYLMLDFAPELREREVPDPYYGAEHGFEKVLDMLELCMEELVDVLQEQMVTHGAG
jgi:protein-tyrosine phosphatase